MPRDFVQVVDGAGVVVLAQQIEDVLLRLRYFLPLLAFWLVLLVVVLLLCLRRIIQEVVHLLLELDPVFICHELYFSVLPGLQDLDFVP